MDTFDYIFSLALLGIPAAAWLAFILATWANEAGKPRNRKTGSRFVIGDFQQVIEKL